MSISRLSTRCAFSAEVKTPTATGGVDETVAVQFEVWGNIHRASRRAQLDAIEAGAEVGRQRALLIVRDTQATRQIQTTWLVQTTERNGQLFDWQVRSDPIADRAGYLKLQIEERVGGEG